MVANLRHHAARSGLNYQIFSWDPGEDTKKIIAFRENLIAGKEIKYETFREVHDFENKLSAVISAYVQRLVRADQERSQNEGLATPTEVPGEPEGAGQEVAYSPFSAAGAGFLRGFIASAETRAGAENISATQVACFRLLGSIVSKPSNDEETLGPHDANLIFLERNEFEFGERELTGLIRTGLQHFPSESVPLWYWYAAASSLRRSVGTSPSLSLRSCSSPQAFASANL